MNEYCIISNLEDAAEARLLEVLLEKRGVPYVIRSYQAPGDGGPYRLRRGWGHIEALEEHREAILDNLDKLRGDRQDGELRLRLPVHWSSRLAGAGWSPLFLWLPVLLLWFIFASYTNLASWATILPLLAFVHSPVLYVRWRLREKGYRWVKWSDAGRFMQALGLNTKHVPWYDDAVLIPGYDVAKDIGAIIRLAQLKEHLAYNEWPRRRRKW